MHTPNDLPFLPPELWYEAVHFEVTLRTENSGFIPTADVEYHLHLMKEAALDLQLREYKLIWEEVPSEYLLESSAPLRRIDVMTPLSSLYTQDKTQTSYYPPLVEELSRYTLADIALRIYRYETGSITLAGAAAGLAIALITMTLGEDVREEWKKTNMSKRFREILSSNIGVRQQAFSESYERGGNRSAPSNERPFRVREIVRDPDRIKMTVDIKRR